MQNETDVLRDVAKRLDDAEIAYMLTGSMAMNYYAQPRMTRDIDLVVELAARDADAIVRLFHPDYYISPESVRDSIARESLFNAIHQESIIKVDFIVRKEAAYRRVEFARRRRVEVLGFPTWIVSLEDLILSKLLWAKDSHSEFQLRDVRNLARAGYDAEYLQAWTKTLGITNLWEECQP